MILDTQETFSELQSIVAAAGDTVSTNVYDTGAAADSGAGEPIDVYVKLGAAVTSGGAATVQVVLQDSADNATFADVQTLTPALALAALTLNKELVRARLPIGLRRYLRLVYRIGTATTTAGTVSGYLVKDTQVQQYLPNGFAVL